ncbi:phage replisome organizer N-terminal domain-containing protein, partial [Streptococcus pneumoniae]|nr:phage replisome organizer N-terminal domain-containing protein [Streptococcus pneumoniae]
MNGVQWIKITTDIFDDEKIQLIESMPEGDTLIVIWFKILVLAGKQNNSGILSLGNKVYYTEEMLSTVFRR